MVAPQQIQGLVGSDGGGARRPLPTFRIVPDSNEVRAILRALMSAGPTAGEAGWRPTPRGVAIELRLGVQRIGLEVHAESPEAAMDLLLRASPLGLDLAVMLLSTEPPSLHPGRRLVRAADILQVKGYRRWGAERRAVEAQLSAELALLAALHHGEGAEAVFPVVVLPADSWSFVYEPATWLKVLFDRSPLRLIDSRVLEFDHRANRGADVLAKKLGIHFSLSAGGRGDATHKVAALMSGIGLPTSAVASRTGRGGRLADRFEEALLRLRECDLFDVRYRGSRLGEERDRAKGWIKQWLASELVVTAMSSRTALGPRSWRDGADDSLDPDAALH